MFKCKVCIEKDKYSQMLSSEKDAQITQLREEVLYLKSLVYNPNSNDLITYQNIEANKILEGSHENLETDDAKKDWLKEQQEAQRIVSEREAMLTGNY